MGASTWVNFTPYDLKPAVALQRLRQQVFASGQYRYPRTLQDDLALARAMVRTLPPTNGYRESAASARAKIEIVRQNPDAYDTPSQRQQQEALFRFAGFTPPAGSPVEQQIAFFEFLAEQTQKIAVMADPPQLLRFYDAVEAGKGDGLPAAEKEMFQRAQQVIAASPRLQRKFRQTATPPTHIDELLERAGADGTHSILDITRVGRRAAHATASPLPAKDILREFGTEQPTRKQVEASVPAFAEALIWRAVYFTLYEDGQPSEWAFVGSTGD